MATRSNGERKIAALFDEGDIIYQEQVALKGCVSSFKNSLYFDFAVYEDEAAKEQGKIKFLLEFQGKQHYEKAFTTDYQFKMQQKNDNIKRKFCKSRKIPLVEISYQQYNSITLEEILDLGNFWT